ncbi:MAG: hypothetical protein HQL56_01465 [Magnetococcales bacterium]|nr:hypothetical protein [Magnetococcales bacterium]
MAEDKNQMLLKFVVEFDKRLETIENDLANLQERVQAVERGDASQSLESKNTAEIQKIQNSLLEFADSMGRSGKNASFLEKKIEAVKREANSSMVVITVVFAVLLVITLFVRTS